MSLPTMSGVGRATADPELRFGSSGTAICKVNLAFNSRKKDEPTGQWIDDKTFFVEGVAFKQTAENLAEAITRGMELLVSGRLVTEQWDDRNGGGKRSKTSLLIDSIGPAINNFQTAKVSKMERGSAGNAPRGGSNDDPWGAAQASVGQSSATFDDQAPF